VLGEGDALQLAHVAEAQLAVWQRQHHPVVPVPRFSRCGPAQQAGHPEVHQQRRADQPLAMTVRLAEPPAAQ
jgi:hypothetical protein